MPENSRTLTRPDGAGLTGQRRGSGGVASVALAAALIAHSDTIAFSRPMPVGETAEASEAASQPIKLGHR